ncbi:MAG: response regulator [Acidobacteria bacterium]|nr:response regulator [Acidobacteriota bacterium]MBV9476371.1 response regulator [Acidobacteriota bacterium]
MGSSVLIVDDDPTVAESLREVMNGYDISLEIATNAESAASLLDTRGYCGVVLDLVLSGGNGFDVLRHMRARGVIIPTIVITEKLPSYVREMLDEDQVKLVFPKPVEPRLLAAVVRGLCGIA